MSVADVLSKALELPESDRAALAKVLLRSLHDQAPGPDWQAAWGSEIERRLNRMDAGLTSARDWRDAVHDVQHSVRVRK